MEGPTERPNIKDELVHVMNEFAKVIDFIRKFPEEVKNFTALERLGIQTFMLLSAILAHPELVHLSKIVSDLPK